MGLIETAGAIISRAQQRVEVSGQNMANMATAGYKARRQFSDLIVDAGIDPQADAAPPRTFTDFTPGKLQNTGNPLDLALSGSGFFTVRSCDAMLYTRRGA